MTALGKGLYLVATPIGNARDITLRALDVLGAADLLVAEDTRVLKRLLEIHGIPLGERRVWSYHDHSGAETRAAIAARIAEGAAVAYASDAGTPLIADPGYRLAAEIAEAGHPVTALPGASALLTALSLSGQPTDRFTFLGFAPKGAARRKLFESVAEMPGTLVFYESPHRIQETLGDAVACFGGERPAALCRELTKRFEETRHAPLQALLDSVTDRPPKGEIVLVIGPAPVRGADPAAIDGALRAALETMSRRDAVAEVVARTGAPRNLVYRRALDLDD